MADPTRRAVLAALAGGTALAGEAALGGGPALAGGAAMAASTTPASTTPDKDALAWGFSFPAVDGGTLDLAAFQGRVLLVTNTASFCGYTYQYEALQSLFDARANEGLTVVGVPSGDFNQESPDNKTVKTFCDTRFGITFPLAGLSHVRGPAAAPFYAWVKATTGWEPAWNFNKVLIGRDGRITGTYASGEEPDGTTLSQAISVALGKATASG